MNFSTGIFCSAHNFQMTCGFALAVCLAIYIAISADFYFQQGRQRIYNTHPYPVQTAGYFITAAAEFPAGMQYSQYYFYRWQSHFWMHFHRNSATIV